MGWPAPTQGPHLDTPLLSGTFNGIESIIFPWNENVQINCTWVQILSECTDLHFTTGWYWKLSQIHSPHWLFFFLSFGMTRAWRNTVHLTVYSHFLVSCFHCRALVWLKALQSHTWKDLTPLVFRNFLILAQLPAQICSLQERLTVPPTITAGRLLGSSRLIAKLRTHTERVSRAGQISFFWSIVNVESAIVHNYSEHGGTVGQRRVQVTLLFFSQSCHYRSNFNFPLESQMWKGVGKVDDTRRYDMESK